MIQEREVFCSRVADRARQDFGFDPISILAIVTTLLPMLTECFKKEEPAGDPKQYLRDHFSETENRFDSFLVKRARPQTRRAARKEGKGHLTKQQLDDITVSAFRQAMEEDDATISALMVAA